MSRTRKERAGLVASVMLLASCGGSMPERPRADEPPPLEPDATASAAIAPAVSASSVASAAPAPSASVEQEASEPTKPAAAYRWICSAGKSGGMEAFLAVNDDGKEIEIGGSNSADGPFRRMKEEGGMTILHDVLGPKELRDPDLTDAFRTAGVKPFRAARLTVYGLALRGGWSVGMGVFSDSQGKYLGRFGWGTRVEFARPCAAG